MMSHLIWIYAVCKLCYLCFLLLNPIALRKAKIVDSIGLSECNKVKGYILVIFYTSQSSRFSNIIRNNILEKKQVMLWYFVCFSEHGSKSFRWCKCTESIFSDEEPQHGAVFKSVTPYEHLLPWKYQFFWIQFTYDRVGPRRNTPAAAR